MSKSTLALAIVITTTTARLKFNNKINKNNKSKNQQLSWVEAAAVKMVSSE